MITKKVFVTPKQQSQAVQGGVQGNVGILKRLSAATDASTAISVGSNRIIALFNTGTSVAYYLTGDATVAAPTNANGFPVPPQQYLFINMGADNFIRTASGVMAFHVIDESQATLETEHNLFPEA